ncbi:MAG TPA: hypothetical protein VN380_00835 [Thermoanaerobaculia bacterium]|jgi:hypothetical protein|nr:hypothetical protein [Thermoanaerobaculia bacterium]
MMLNVAIDRPDARWLPSRHRFAVARLIGYTRLGRARSAVERPEHLILSIDRDQTAGEMHLAAFWVIATVACYIAASLPFALPLSIVLSVPLAAIAIHLPVVLAGLTLRALTGDGDHIKLVSVMMMTLLLIASSYVATTRSWARYAAWLFFAILLLNGVAAIILWLLRGAIQEAEERCAR